MANPNSPDDKSEEQLKTALDELLDVLSRLPVFGKLVKDLRELRSLLVERRPPRVAAIGRRGSGKSSLANALLGAPVLETGAVADTTRAAQWIDVQHLGRRVRWLDTPGLRAGDAPERRDLVRRALATEPPDVVLVTCKATQVDAGIDEDAAEVSWLLGQQRSLGVVPPGVIGVVTKVDELAPVTVKAPPYEGDKRANIDKAVDVFRTNLERARVESRKVVPVGTYLRFFRDGTVAVDWRWNLDALGLAIMVALPDATQFEAARAFEGARTLRQRVARRIVNTCTSIAFLVGIAPLPVADLAILAPLQSAMITSLALLGGRRIDSRGVSEWLASLGVNVGAGVALREAARALIKLMPGVGSSISGAVAASGTWALGVSATRYFIEDASIDAARRAFDEARRNGMPRELGASGEAADERSEPKGDPPEET